MAQGSFKIYGIELRWIVIGACYLIMCAIVYPDMRATMSLPAILAVTILGAFWGWLLIVVVINPCTRWIEKNLAKIFNMEDKS